MDNSTISDRPSPLATGGEGEGFSSQAVPARERFSSAFLPDIRKAMSENADAFESLEIECSICYLTIYPTASENKVLAEKVGALACGHLHCLNCIEQWCESRPATGVNCPFCRQRSTNRQSNVLYTIQSADDVLCAPLCLSEGGSFPKTPFSNRYFDYGAISDSVEEVLLADVLCLEYPVLSDDATNVVESLGLQILTERKEVDGRMYARQKLDSSIRFVILVQIDWYEPKTLIWECVADGAHTKLLSEIPSTHVSVEDGRLMPSSQAQSSDQIPSCCVPLYATGSGLGLMSNVLKKANKKSNRVWTPCIVGFGIGFLDLDVSAEHRRNLVKAMASSSFESAMAQRLSTIVKMYSTPESESTAGQS